jgi:hypothetical protein
VRRVAAWRWPLLAGNGDKSSGRSAAPAPLLPLAGEGLGRGRYGAGLAARVSGATGSRRAEPAAGGFRRGYPGHRIQRRYRLQVRESRGPASRNLPGRCASSARVVRAVESACGHPPYIPAPCGTSPACLPSQQSEVGFKPPPGSAEPPACLPPPLAAVRSGDAVSVDVCRSQFAAARPHQRARPNTLRTRPLPSPPRCAGEGDKRGLAALKPTLFLDVRRSPCRSAFVGRNPRSGFRRQTLWPAAAPLSPPPPPARPARRALHPDGGRRPGSRSVRRPAAGTARARPGSRRRA